MIRLKNISNSPILSSFGTKQIHDFITYLIKHEAEKPMQTTVIVGRKESLSIKGCKEGKVRCQMPDGGGLEIKEVDT